jgi:hypothetical protein
MWAALPDAVKREIEDKGVWMRPSAYGDGPYPITRALIEDGRKHLILKAPFETGCPVRILQGSLDPDVPWQHAMKLVACLPKDDVADDAGEGRRSPLVAARGHRTAAADRGRTRGSERVDLN